ncbi:SCP2 domain-containing protein [Marinimicrobium sp. ABcell2]|uniref:ubiquinone biosynthesis accessory factor UbiJ n=1 Tax=Marinimicrobium sp. ABcell2 TaxID=3069751 RepID=UPI0027B14FEF|nr:SCP2 sterol-binding domain-containing protein [Marinimicrobium sp. ABcell2]MDQ2075997.1 SCP2 sterol-binding domain-containing protein [Marinimicrobium sp. ABcell2]
MDATLITGALVATEQAINKALEYDPASRAALGKLNDHVLALTLEPLALTVYVAPGTEAVRLLSHFEGEPSVHVRGPLPALIRLATGHQGNLKATGAQVSGDSGVLLELRSVLQNLDLDWEEALSQLFGDVAGHGAAQGLRDAGLWLRDRGTSSRRLLSEFMTEELRVLPSRQELQDYYRAVDDVRFDLDRVEARMRHLAARLQPSSPEAPSTRRRT